MAEVGDRIRFTAGFMEGEIGTITRIDYIAGIPWFKIKFDSNPRMERGGQYEGMFEVLKC